MKTRRIVKGIVATLVTVVIGLLLCEAFLWVIGFPTPWQMEERPLFMADDELGHRLRPDLILTNLRTPYFTHPEIRTNSLGFRDGEVAIPKPAGVFRILSLGDSYAFGWGVKAEESYSSWLEATLAERSAGSRVEVINAGVTSYASWKERLLLDRTIETLTPDLVICQVADNDLGHSPAREKRFEQMVPRWIRTFLRHSRLFGLTRVLYYEGGSGVRSILAGNAERQRRLSRARLWTYMESVAAEVDSGLVHDPERLASYVDDYTAMRSRSGNRFVCLIVPNRYQIYAAKYFSAGFDSLERTLERAGVPTINVTDYLRERKDAELCLEDTHPNAVGHYLIADTLATYLILKGFVPPAPGRVVEPTPQ